MVRVSDVADDVARDGWAAVRDVLAPDEVAAASDALDDVFASEADVAVARGWATDVYRVAYALPAKHPTFLELCTHPRLLALATEVLGDAPIVAGLNGLDLPPSGSPQRLHRDHPVPTPGTTLYLHVVCALDAFTRANGATVVVPRSHLTADPDPVHRPADAVPVAIDAGGAVVFDGSLVHAAGVNGTSSPRRALHVFFARPWVRPHWDFPATLPDDVAARLTDEQRRVLGFTGRPRRFDLVARRVERD